LDCEGGADPKPELDKRNLNRNLKPFLPFLGSGLTIMKKNKSSKESRISFPDRITDLRVKKMQLIIISHLEFLKVWIVDNYLRAHF
jgi:hypothetical protein